MKNQIIIHIGYPKTGTTWLQKEVFPNIENVNVLVKGCIHDLIVARNSIFAESKKCYQYYSNLQKRQISCIVSDEDFVSIRKEHVSQLKKAQRLKKIFPTAKILIFLRNHVDIIASDYTEYIKGGGTLKFEDYYCQLKNAGILEMWNYSKVINIYVELFGKDNVIVFDYEKMMENDFLLQLKNKIGISINEFVVKKNRINKRYALFLLKLARIINMFNKRQMYSNYPPKKCIYHIPFLLNFSKWVFEKFNLLLPSAKTSQIIKQDLELDIKSYFSMK